MTNNLIQWPKAVYWTKTYNPIIGCQKISPACQNCYAKAWADRFNVSFEPHASSKKNPPKKGICFCGNVTDLFGDWVSSPASIIKSAINWRSDATYLWLTKRVQNMCDALPEVEGLTTFQHYFGFTAEDQEWYDKRMSIVREAFPYWAKLWISVEPMLGPIDMGLHKSQALPKWVVVGCESGANRRPCRIEWIESIVNQCREVSVPVFVKQICLSSGKFTNKIEEFPKHLQIRQVPWTKEGDLFK